MGRREAAEALLWEALLGAWNAGDLHMAREFDAHLSAVEDMTDQMFDLWCQPISVLT